MLSWWVFIAMALLIVVRIERLPLASVGWHTPGFAAVGWGGGLFVVAFVIAGLTAALLMPAFGFSQDAARALKVTALPLSLQLGIFATAAVVEELVCRGLVISRLAPLCPPFAMVVSVAIFALPHVFSWRPAQLIFVLPLGLVFALFFLWRRDLPACILAHFLVDAAGFLMMRLPR